MQDSPEETKINTSPVIPDFVSKIEFEPFFNSSIAGFWLPESSKLIDLTFTCSFNQTILPGSLPNKLRFLKFGDNFNQKIIPGSLPNSISTLCFGYNFNQPICKGEMPNDLYELTFGYKFNQIISPDSLPDMDTINFGRDFNQQLGEGVLPEGLTCLTLPEKYDKILFPKAMPRSLVFINIGRGSYDSCTSWVNRDETPNGEAIKIYSKNTCSENILSMYTKLK